MQPSFSVIVTVYNLEKYLRDFFDSLVNQTFEDWECLCIDDGSTDYSSEIIDEIASKDSRIKVIHQENSGVGKARNVGLSLSTGRWITWADADDLLSPRRFEVAKHILDKEDPDLLQLDFVMRQEVPAGFLEMSPNLDYVVAKGPDAYELALRKIHPMAMLWLSFAKRELYDGLKYREEMRVKGDCFLSSALYPRCKVVCLGKDQGYFYRQTPNSLIRSKRKAMDCIRILQAYLDMWNRQKEFAEGVGKISVLRWRVRCSSRANVLDWIFARPKNEDRSLASKVHEAYDILRKAVGFKGNVFNLRWRWQFVFWAYERWGIVWPIIVVGEVVSALGKVKRAMLGH